MVKFTPKKSKTKTLSPPKHQHLINNNLTKLVLVKGNNRSRNTTVTNRKEDGRKGAQLF